MEETKPNNIDLTQYFKMIARRKWLFIIPLAAFTVAFTVSSFFFPKVYEARAVILIEEQNVVNPLLANLAVTTPVKARLGALREEILSWPRLFQLVEKLGMNENVNNPLEVEQLISSIRKNIYLDMKSDNIVIIAYRGSNPFKTQKLVNTLCDILIKQNVASQLKDTESAIDFIDEQLVIYKDKLEKSETALREFNEVYGFHKVTMSDALVSPAQSQVKETSTFGAPMKRINSELADLEADLVLATIDCTDEHPRVIGLRRRIEALKEKRDQYIKEVAKRAGIDAESYVDIADSYPRQQEELIRLTRDRATNEKIYGMLLERFETAKITERLDNSDNRTKFRVIEPARLPIKPVKPNKGMISFMGLFLGIAVGFGLVFALDFMDTSFKNDEKLKEHFEAPVLGNISKIVTKAEHDLRRKIDRNMIPVTGLAVVILTVIMIVAGKSIISF